MAFDRINKIGECLQKFKSIVCLQWKYNFGEQRNKSLTSNNRLIFILYKTLETGWLTASHREFSL